MFCNLDEIFQEETMNAFEIATAAIQLKRTQKKAHVLLPQ